MPSEKRRQGDFFEQLALDYLSQQGLQLLARNVRWAGGEIDLIMQQLDCWVFVEVRYRADWRFGGPLASITPTKQQRLQQTALWYLQQQGQSPVCRFDVIAISGDAPWQIEWIKNAF